MKIWLRNITEAIFELFKFPEFIQTHQNKIWNYCYAIYFSIQYFSYWISQSISNSSSKSFLLWKHFEYKLHKMNFSLESEINISIPRTFHYNFLFFVRNFLVQTQFTVNRMQNFRICSAMLTHIAIKQMKNRKTNWVGFRRLSCWVILKAILYSLEWEGKGQESLQCSRFHPTHKFLIKLKKYF